jgi:hypothetical protein
MNVCRDKGTTSALSRETIQRAGERREVVCGVACSGNTSSPDSENARSESAEVAGDAEKTAHCHVERLQWAGMLAPPRVGHGGRDPMNEKAGECYTLKGGLKRLLKCCEGEVQKRIADAACSVSDLAMHATMLVKLYVLHCFETGDAIPKITYDLMRHAFKVVGGRRLPVETSRTDEIDESKKEKQKKRNRVSEAQRRKLSAFYDEACSALPSYMHLSDAIGYTGGELVTNVEVNIKQHYVDFVTAYVRTAFQQEQELQAIIAQLDDDAHGQSRALNVGDEWLQSPETLHAWIQDHRSVVRPSKAQFKEE